VPQDRCRNRGKKRILERERVREKSKKSLVAGSALESGLEWES
jgi:hypothetical protein